jgi:hypothetical protein
MIKFKNANAFNPEIFTLREDVLYPITFEDDFTVFTESDNGVRVGIAKYADPLIVEILNEAGEVINEPFPESEDEVTE